MPVNNNRNVFDNIANWFQDQVAPKPKPAPAAPTVPATPTRPAGWQTTPSTPVTPPTTDIFGGIVGQPTTPPARPLRDATLLNGVATATLPLGKGARGTPTQAIQYSLAKLGMLKGKVDGAFGDGTAKAVRAFQQSKGLPQTGAVDEATLASLDATMATFDGRVPAAKTNDPHGYLRDFNARGLSPITINDRSQPMTWQNPEVQEAYGKFVGEYWNVLKDNKVESDCKTMAQEFMDAFRSKLKADTGVELPLPSNDANRMKPFTWSAGTAADPKGMLNRTDTMATVRPGYELVQQIEKLDPKASLIPGVQLVSSTSGGANEVALSATPTTTWQNAIDNQGDEKVSEVPLDKLKAGDLIFIDHTGDGRWDHTVNVANVERRPDGTARITLAVGSFDDMKDADGDTKPRGGYEVNTYSEEVQVEVGADGRIANSKVTWTSEPTYLSNARYSHRSTLMELRPGGRMMVGRWGG